MPDWNAIPGETPLTDISGLKFKGNDRSRAKVNELEAENIRKVTVKYLSGKPAKKSARFDYAWAVSLHKEMFGEVWKWAGVVRKCDLNIGVRWQNVESLLFELMKGLDSWTGAGIDMLKQSAMLHHRAVEIHPFLNGNGRWSRMMANIWLKLHDEPAIRWPEEAIGNISTIRDEYLAAIQKADQGDYDSLVELHKKYSGAAE